MTAATNSIPEPEVSAPATDGCATTSMPPRSPQEYHFLPSVFIIDSGEVKDSIMPHHLVPGTDRASLTVEHLSLPNFWRFLRRTFKAKPDTHRLLAYVPGICGGPEMTVDMKNRRVWHSQLQSCHNAGWTRVFFLIQERQVGDDDVPEMAWEDGDDDGDDVHLVPGAAVGQRTSRIGQLGCLLVLVVLVVLAGAAGRCAYASGWVAYLSSFMQGLAEL